MTPFILVGPEGCGKNNAAQPLLRKRIKIDKCCNAPLQRSDERDTHYSKARDSCSLFSTNSGRVFRPRDCERLVLFLKDINLPKPDKYNTCMLIAFLQQLITFGGFYGEPRILGIENVHIIVVAA